MYSKAVVVTPPTMVATNPLFAGGHYYKKFKATVVNDIWPEVLFFSLVATSESFDDRDVCLAMVLMCAQWSFWCLR